MANFFAIKQEVFNIVTSALPDFKTTWGFGTKNVPRTWAYIGTLHWPEGEWVTNRSREYRVTIPIVLNAIKGRTSERDAEDWMSLQVEALVGAFGATSSLRSLGVITWNLVPRDFGSQPHVDGLETQAALELQVTYRP